MDTFGPVATIVAAIGGTVLAVVSIWYARRADRLLRAIYEIVSRGGRA